MAFPNKYSDDCVVCGQEVPAKDGLVHQDNGNWRCVCSTEQCLEAEGLAEDPTRELRAEDDTLVVDTPYEPDNLSVIKSMPGATFDGDRKVWEVSADPADRPRVLELADRLELDVPDELRAYELDASVRQRLDEADAKGAYDYQLDGIEFLATHDRALLADDMGLGKTMQAILALPDDAAVVVTCPNSAKYVWRDEFAKWRGDDFDVEVPGTDEIRPPEDGEIIVVNYARLPGQIDPDWDGGYDDHGVDLGDDWDGVDVVIGDEAHAFKNREAQRTRRFKTLGERSDKIWLLTGTPLPNRPLDLWGTLSAAEMAFDVFDRWQTFLDLYNGRKNRHGGIEFSGTPDAEASERLRRVMVKRDKEDVLDGLPDKTVQEVTVNGLPDDLESELDEMALEMQAAGQTDVLPSFERFSEIRRQLAIERIPHAMEYADEYAEQDRPLVVFSDHRAPVEALGERDGWSSIHGGIADEERADRIERFQNGDLDGLALTIGAGKEGITLTRADTMLFVDLSWTPGDNLQAEDRIRRIGQDSDHCHYIRLVSDHALDQHILDLLDWKMQVIADGVDGELEASAPETIDLDVDEIDDDVWRERVEAYEASTLDAEERAETAEVLEWMLARCDGARSEDHVGFNGWDAGVARRLAGDVRDSDAAARYARDLLEKYEATQWGVEFDVDWYDDSDE